MPMPTLPKKSPRLLRRPEVELKTGLTRSSIYEKMTQGNFPRPVRTGPAMVAWVEGEVDDWIAGRVAERDAGRASKVAA
jgi:prophage regulatory protein